MPVKKWSVQYAFAIPMTFLMLAGIQYWKGRGLAYAVEFGILWSLASVALFAVIRVYYFRKGMHCTVCNDLPQETQPRQET
ncbi:hypothetical protein [Microbulbifer spongiae]|uniref:Uncharacterized protein n=1 Tax=Microbulbifer spongiae TaxID=2944933 RepID=A0ABY9EJ79_9GAMM|nr:hypothetical protein [Microbulbifer sp. MI-G]WKD51261.1 hypothetical protein M8T91_07545 [Microbulbifer sp. MI-G]